jgi:hypothetical protein
LRGKAEGAAEGFAAAFARLRAAPGGAALTLSDVINAVCTGRALEAAVGALQVLFSWRTRLIQQSLDAGIFGAVGAATRARASEPEGFEAARLAPCEHIGGGCDCNEGCSVS